MVVAFCTGMHGHTHRTANAPETFRTLVRCDEKPAAQGAAHFWVVLVPIASVHAKSALTIRFLSAPRWSALFIFSLE